MLAVLVLVVVLVDSSIRISNVSNMWLKIENYWLK